MSQICSDDLGIRRKNIEPVFDCFFYKFFVVKAGYIEFGMRKRIYLFNNLVGGHKVREVPASILNKLVVFFVNQSFDGSEPAGEFFDS